MMQSISELAALTGMGRGTVKNRLALLSGMSEDETRRLIVKLSSEKAGQVREAARA